MRAVVIDDADPSITYMGQGWFQDYGSQDGIGNFGATYQHTLHGTRANGSLSFSFRGTFVRVFGTIQLTTTADGTIDPSWECFIDNISIGATKPFNYVENNWTLCDKSNLPDGQHELTIKISVANQTFWLDTIQYTPSPSISIENVVFMVENQDPEINLGPGWQALGDTANATQIMGSVATFSFTGTSLSWVGFIPTEFSHNASIATYSVDEGPPVSFPLAGLPLGEAPTTYNQIFFTTPDLPSGPHSLVITYQGTVQQTPLTLDFLYVAGSWVSKQLLPSRVSSLSNILPTSNQSSSLDQPPATISGVQLEAHESSSPIKIIIGCTIGGSVFILFAFLLLWKYRNELKFNSAGVMHVPPPDPLVRVPGYSVSSARADVLINPAYLDSLGVRMQRGSVTKSDIAL